VLGEIAAAHGIGAPAVALAFLMAEGHAAIPASSNPDHLRANLAALEVALGAEEVGRIRRLDRGERTVNPAKSPRWDD
jgi:2,5-diketo-D-gluconate reductase B